MDKQNKAVPSEASEIEVCRWACFYEAVAGDQEIGDQAICNEIATQTLPASWWDNPSGEVEIPLCPRHRTQVLSLRCMRWINREPASHHVEKTDPQRQSDGYCYRPAGAGQIWMCDCSHDEGDCDEVGCPGCSIIPICPECATELGCQL